MELNEEQARGWGSIVHGTSQSKFKCLIVCERVLLRYSRLDRRILILKPPRTPHTETVPLTGMLSLPSFSRAPFGAPPLVRLFLVLAISGASTLQLTAQDRRDRSPSSPFSIF